MLVMCASTLISLTACATSSDVASPLTLPDLPPALKACVIETVPAIPGARGTELSRAVAAGTIAEQRVAALSSFRCKQDFSAWYLDLRKSINETVR